MSAAISSAAKLDCLRRPSIYPDAPTRIEVVETHMSWVFLTERRAYKMLRPVRLPFLDFTTLERRRFFCHESLRLNRRLAAGIYLDVVPLVIDAERALHLGGPGDVADWLVEMRRVPEEAMLDRAIRAGRVSDADVQCFTEVLAGYYQRAEPVDLEPGDYCGNFRHRIDEQAHELVQPQFGLAASRVQALSDITRESLARLEPMLIERALHGHVIEAHGDLRPEHVCLLDPPVMIDCLEFDRNLRTLDTADELAYLAMECELIDAPRIGEVMLATYRGETDDRPPPALLDFYKLFRAMLRAKIAAWHIHDYPADQHPHWLAQAGRYLALAERYAQRLG